MQVLLTLEFDAASHEQVSSILDNIVIAVRDSTGYEPSMGLEIDGTHREPDSPSEEL